MAPDDAREVRTLLLVDAGPALRTVAQLHLRAAGYDLLEASDEATALEVLRTAPVDLAVCAMQHARVDVAACLRRMRADAALALRELPVLLVAAAGPADELEALCTAYPPAAVLDGPHTGPRLARAVERMLRGAG